MVKSDNKYKNLYLQIGEVFWTKIFSAKSYLENHNGEMKNFSTYNQTNSTRAKLGRDVHSLGEQTSNHLWGSQSKSSEKNQDFRKVRRRKKTLEGRGEGDENFCGKNNEKQIWLYITRIPGENNENNIENYIKVAQSL